MVGSSGACSSSGWPACRLFQLALRSCVATCAVVNYPGHACSCPQDLVYGDATSKEVIAFLTANQAIPAADKVGGQAVALCCSGPR